MKKNILLAFCCCSLLAFTACSDDYNDATSKHVYGENENPYLKIDTEAQISATGALEVNGEHSYTVKLSDYAAKFEEKMGMSVDAVIDGLSTGETVFYPINTTRNQWLKTPYNKIAEDHQTKNALALVNKNAALYIKDSEATQKLLDTAIETVHKPDLLKELSNNITKLAIKDSATIIAKEVCKLALKYKENHEH